jgi:hypothetical protein
MTTLAVMAFLIAAYWMTSRYFRTARRNLEMSSAPWDRLYSAAKEVISDADMPQSAAAFAAAAVVCAGCGCVTRGILLDALTGRLERRPARSKPPMTREQKEVFSRVVVNALYYDSLRAPVSGFLMRSLVMPGLKAASESAHPKPRVRVAQIAASSKEAISHRSEGKKILALAALN